MDILINVLVPAIVIGWPIILFAGFLWLMSKTDFIKQEQRKHELIERLHKQLDKETLQVLLK